MRLRFWLGFSVVAAIAVGSIALALIVHDRERHSFERTQRSEAGRAAHQAEALAALSVGQLASAAAFYQAEGHFSRHEFNVIADSCWNRARWRQPPSSNRCRGRSARASNGSITSRSSNAAPWARCAGRSRGLNTSP